VSDFISYVNSLENNDNEKPQMHHFSDRISIPQTPIDHTLVEIVKSFKNSSGFYKINGTLENQGAVMFSDIQVIKYYKIPSMNDTTLICYEQNIVNCEYKSDNNQIPLKSFFLTMPPESQQTSINPNQ
jgi:hypothetical protein